MIYIYRQTASDGARALEDALNDIGVPARFTQGRLLRERFRPDRDKLICWGSHYPGVVGALNNVEGISKFTEAVKLKEGGVSTIEVSRTRPVPTPATRGQFELSLTGRLSEIQVRAQMEAMQQWLDAPLPPAQEWLPRKSNHVGGNDLLNPVQMPDYWSRKESIVNEYRIHIFQGKSVRAGKKEHRAEFANPHQWIRSFEGGWFINYAGFQSNRPMRELAAKAVQVLGLDFGAVDIGERADGSLIVFEVNRAPGIEGNTVETYAEKIKRWVRGEEDVAAAA